MGSTLEIGLPAFALSLRVAVGFGVAAPERDAEIAA